MSTIRIQCHEFLFSHNAMENRFCLPGQSFRKLKFVPKPKEGKQEFIFSSEFILNGHVID